MQIDFTQGPLVPAETRSTPLESRQKVDNDKSVGNCSKASVFRLGRRPALDGLRACSIFLVLIAHVQLLEPRVRLLAGGFLGVDVFFVISGFLITSLLVTEYQDSGRIHLGHFYMRRALRLLPGLVAVLLFTCLLGMLLGSLSVVNLSPFRLLSIIFYFMNWVRAFEPPQSWFLGHFWSLAVEEQFYSVWPITLLLLLHLNRTRKAIFLVVATGIAVSFGLKAILFLHGVGEPRIIFGSDTRAEPILWGCLLALALHWNVVPVFFWRHAGPISALGLLVGSSFAVFADQSYALMCFGGFSLFAFSVTAIILKTVVDPKSRLTLCLSRSWMVWIGKRSYGIYLWHWPIYKLARVTFVEAWVFVPLAILITLLVSTVSYRYIEAPFLRRKIRYARARLQEVPSPKARRLVRFRRDTSTPGGVEALSEPIEGSSSSGSVNRSIMLRGRGRETF